MDYIPVTLNTKTNRPLYCQIYDALSGEIAAGHIRAGEKLPARRSAAQALGISRNTVESAYAMLEDEGYIETRSRSGHYVRDISPLAPTPEPLHAKDDPAKEPELRYVFSTRSMDAALFPAKTWARIEKEVLYTQPQLLNHGHPQGDLVLREAIAEYLAACRSVRCAPQQIVVGAGMEYLLGLLAQLLRGGIVATEDPGYEKTAVILHNNGVATVPVAVDEGGMQVSALRCAGATIAYVTPSHQFPSGVSMPIGRRSELLGWVAEDPLRYIIEDDYDSEFRFDGRPIPSLQGLGGGQVIYLGTFTKSIAPSIRIAYMVLPRTLLVRYHEMFGSYSSTVSRFEQHTLAQFIAEGHFARYLNRARGAYRRRRDVLRCALTQEFGAGQVRFSGLHTGLYCTAQFTLGLAEAQLITRAAEVGVQVTGLSRYYAHPEKAPASTLVLGYSSMDEHELCAAAKLLAAAWSTGLH